MFKDAKISDAPKVMTTPNLNKYGEDLTKGSYIKDPSVGRDEEIRRIMQVLLYPEKDKSIIITGEAGCGKTAIVRGLAYRIQNGDVPEPLKNIKIISIDTATMVAGTKYVGTLEEKMKAILEEASKDKNIILFIDEIHQAISGGKSEGSDNTVSEILKPYLDYGKVRVIGATTTEEYSEYVEPNKAFKKPSTSKPGVIQPANINKRAFKTRLNIPRVITLIGKVITCKSGLIKVLISARIMQTNIALKKFSTRIPGIIQAVRIIAKANNTYLKSMFNIFSPFYLY